MMLGLGKIYTKVVNHSLLWFVLVHSAPTVCETRKKSFIIIFKKGLRAIRDIFYKLYM